MQATAKEGGGLLACGAVLRKAWQGCGKATGSVFQPHPIHGPAQPMVKEHDLSAEMAMGVRMWQLGWGTGCNQRSVRRGISSWKPRPLGEAMHSAPLIVPENRQILPRASAPSQQRPDTTEQPHTPFLLFPIRRPNPQNLQA